jgi:hypothetical protein
MKRSGRWREYLGARLYLGGVALVLGLAAAACAREVPTGVEMVSTPPANTWDVTYLCELGYPGYEGYCDDFGSLLEGGCGRELLDRWDLINAEASCRAYLPVVNLIPSAFLADVKARVETLIDNHGGSDAKCSDLKLRAQRILTNLRVAQATSNGGILAGKNGVHLTWYIQGSGLVPAEEMMIVISPARYNQGVDKVAETVLHEILHSIDGYESQLGYQFDTDIGDAATGQTVKEIIDAEVQRCSALTP